MAAVPVRRSAISAPARGFGGRAPRPRDVAGEAAPLEVLREAREAAILAQDGHHFRGFTPRDRQVARRAVADRELQERDQQHGDLLPPGHHAEVGVVHGASAPVRAASWLVRQALGRSRSGRDVHRRESPQHARRATSASGSPARAVKIRPP